MKALILAAGYATRLFPLTKRYPKPLLLVKEKPIIDYIIDKLTPIKEINEIIVVTNSKFISQFKRWAKTRPLEKKLSLLDDLTKSLDDRRGAIGDMFFAISRKKIKEDLLVIGGDNLFDADLNKLVAFSRLKQNSPVIGAFNIKSLKSARNYGVLRLDGGKRITDFEEKPKAPKSTFVAMCLYYFPKQRLGLIRRYLQEKDRGSDATGFYIDWLRKKIPVYGLVFPGRWYDIGDYKFYNEARQGFTKKKGG